MTENKIPAPPVLAAEPQPGPSGDNSSNVYPGEALLKRLANANCALFTATSCRKELVAAYPELDPICTQIGFGAEQSLGEWSTDPTSVLLILARAARAPPPTPTFDWSQAEIFELITDLIDHHHCPLRNELRRLGLLIRHVDQVHAEARTFDFDGAFGQLEVNLIEHLDHEEQIVFPQCLANESSGRGPENESGATTEVTAGIRDMMSGHDYGAEELSYLLRYVDVAADTISDGDFAVIRLGLHAMAEDLVVHADKERDILMPAAIFHEDILRSKHKPSPP